MHEIFVNRRMNVQRTLDNMLSPILLEIAEMQPILDRGTKGKDSSTYPRKVKDSDNPRCSLSSTKVKDSNNPRCSPSSPKSKIHPILPLKHPHSIFFPIFLVIHSLIRTFARTNA